MSQYIKIDSQSRSGGGVYDSTSSLTIGANILSTSAWSGFIHEVIYYDRALSGSEITD